MSAKPRYSKATIGGHPVHVMLVSFPIAFYTAGLVALITYAIDGSLFAFRIAYTGFLAGAAVAVLAAIFGAIDLLGIPRASAAQKTGFKHMGLNLVSTILFCAAGFMLYRAWGGTPTLPDQPELSYAPALVLAIVAFLAMGIAGWLGWKLVQTHHVGVDDRPTQVRESSGSPGSDDVWRDPSIDHPAAFARKPDPVTRVPRS